MKKLMNIWAKASSSIIILSLVFAIIYTVYLKIQEGVLITALYFLIILFIFGYFSIFFFAPLFYFALSKKKKSEAMKIWAKISTVLYGLTIITILVIYLEGKFRICPYCNAYLYNLTIPFILLLILLAPLFYYGWKKN